MFHHSHRRISAIGRGQHAIVKHERSRANKPDTALMAAYDMMKSINRALAFVYLCLWRQLAYLSARFASNDFAAPAFIADTALQFAAMPDCRSARRCLADFGRLRCIDSPWPAA